jgi:hypothetical protein
MKQLTFGIDFDGTFAADPLLFRELVALIRKHGHKAIMVTQRCRKFKDEVEDVVRMDDLPIVYASGQSKEDAALQAGFVVDIWLDDVPWSVGTARTYRGCP